MRNELQTGLFALSLLLLPSCARDGHRNHEETPASLPAVALANEVCPMMGHEIDTSAMVSYQGRNLAFCCTDCIPAWNKLSADEKAAKFAKVAKR